MSVPFVVRLRDDLRRWKRRRTTSVGYRGRRKRMPRIECLESRELLASVTEFKVPTGLAFVNQIVEGPDGNMWFTEASATASAIGRITPAGVITEFKTDYLGRRLFVGECSVRAWGHNPRR